MGIDDGDADVDGNDRIPLQRLAEAIDNRVRGDSDDDRASNPGSTDQGATDLWGRLATGEVEGRGASHDNRGVTGPSNSPRGKILSYPSPFVFLIHSTLTGLTLAASIILYLSTEVGVLPEHLWVLALPFFIIGLLGAVPILSRWLRIWQPQELG